MPIGVYPGMTTDPTLTDLKAAAIKDEIFGIVRTKYNLRNACYIVPAPNLSFTARVPTGLTGVENVKATEEAEYRTTSWTNVAFDLAAKGKNVVHIGIPLEDKYQTRADIMGIQIRDSIKELLRMENSQISAAMLAGATADGTHQAWSDDSKDPSEDFMRNMASLEDAGFTLTHAVMNNQVYGNLVSNDLVKGMLERGTVAVTGVLGKFCGVNIIKDAAVAASTCYFMDKTAPAVVMADGPEVIVKYGQGDPRFINGYAIAKWVEPKVVIADAIYKFTYT